MSRIPKHTWQDIRLGRARIITIDDRSEIIWDYNRIHREINDILEACDQREMIYKYYVGTTTNIERQKAEYFYNSYGEFYNRDFIFLSWSRADYKFDPKQIEKLINMEKNRRFGTCANQPLSGSYSCDPNKNYTYIIIDFEDESTTNLLSKIIKLAYQLKSESEEPNEEFSEFIKEARILLRLNNKRKIKLD